MNYTIAAFYRFTPLQDLPLLQRELLAAFAHLDLCGTLLLASEGINGTLAGSEAAMGAMLGILHQRAGLPRSDVKFSYAEARPFRRLKIRLKREIITFKQPTADPNRLAGTYVEAREWNALLDDPDVTVLDTRNKYETLIGSFTNAVDPQIETFTDFAAYVRGNLDPARHRKIAMFCTGGIRCEKASAFMKAEGFSEVFHLKGGILTYLEQVAAQDSKWRGDCYVFDRRVAVGHGLAAADYAMCFSCGYPLTVADRGHELYEEGVSCAHCHGVTGDDDKARHRMRQRQMAAQS